jgi:hypothetical protein
MNGEVGSKQSSERGVAITPAQGSAYQDHRIARAPDVNGDSRSVSGLDDLHLHSRRWYGYCFGNSRVRPPDSPGSAIHLARPRLVVRRHARRHGLSPGQAVLKGGHSHRTMRLRYPSRRRELTHVAGLPPPNSGTSAAECGSAPGRKQVDLRIVGADRRAIQAAVRQFRGSSGAPRARSSRTAFRPSSCFGDWQLLGGP